MGVFAVIGLLVGFYGLAARQPKTCFLALMLFGVGVVGDTHGLYFTPNYARRETDERTLGFER